MKTNFVFILFCLITLLNVTAHSETKIAYIDMEFIFNNSVAGKKLTETLNKINKNNQKFFNEKESELKKRELKIISQKNILDKSQIEEQLKNLQSEANIYRNEKVKKINEFNERKINASEQLFKSIEPILIDYSNKNSISIFLQKKNIVIGKSELNKTNEILKIVNQKITEIKFNQ
tara:strand:- start:178 stop:705 length:528 start_codon:yes stop_codon:yes gene_type:complete